MSEESELPSEHEATEVSSDVPRMSESWGPGVFEEAKLSALQRVFEEAKFAHSSAAQREVDISIRDAARAREEARDSAQHAARLAMNAAEAKGAMSWLRWLHSRRLRAMADTARAAAAAAERHVEGAKADLATAMSRLDDVATRVGIAMSAGEAAASGRAEETSAESSVGDATPGGSEEQAGTQRRPRLPGEEIGQPLTPSERAAHQRGTEMRQQALTFARATAEKWAGTAGVLFAALGFATLVQGARQIRTLDDPYQGLVSGGVLLAFALAVAAIVAAAIAAQGVSPTTMTRLTAAELLTYEEAEAEKVQKQLNASRAALLVAIVLVITTVGFLFYAPRDPPRASSLLIVTRAGELVCGTPAPAIRGRLRIKTTGGVIRAVNGRDAVSVTGVVRCPGG